VSFSNPTRQWLFEFEDCVDPDRPSEGRPKAQVYPALANHYACSTVCACLSLRACPYMLLNPSQRCDNVHNRSSNRHNALEHSSLDPGKLSHGHQDALHTMRHSAVRRLYVSDLLHTPNRRHRRDSRGSCQTSNPRARTLPFLCQGTLLPRNRKIRSRAT
jgi:hypothetical protein